MVKRLRVPLAPVVPISIACVPSSLQAMLRAYKDDHTSEIRAEAITTLSKLLGAFVRSHRCCLEVLAAGRLDLVAAVPSSRRGDRSPLHALRGQPWAAGLLQRGPGRVAHLSPAVDGFVVPEHNRSRVRGRGVLLIDDTLTTGAHAQSAAAALRRAGARATVVVVLGRVIRPEASAAATRYWRTATARPYRLDHCCLPFCTASSSTR
jgi:phosphoribosylpyrophosphate synthetase